jgi:hypothetical protein
MRPWINPPATKPKEKPTNQQKLHWLETVLSKKCILNIDEAADSQICESAGESFFTSDVQFIPKYFIS